MKQRRIHFGFAGILALVLMSGLPAISSAVPAKAAPFAYVTNDCVGGFCPAQSTVTVVDVATGTVAATVPVDVIDSNNILTSGNFHPFLVAVAPDGKHAYVT